MIQSPRGETRVSPLGRWLAKVKQKEAPKGNDGTVAAKDCGIQISGIWISGGSDPWHRPEECFSKLIGSGKGQRWRRNFEHWEHGNWKLRAKLRGFLSTKLAWGPVIPGRSGEKTLIRPNTQGKTVSPPHLGLIRRTTAGCCCSEKRCSQEAAPLRSPGNGFDADRRRRFFLHRKTSDFKVTCLPSIAFSLWWQDHFTTQFHR